MIDFRKLITAGVHFGHQTSRWSPKMKPYIWGHKNGVHLIDVSKAAIQLEKAAQFLENVASEGKAILWVGTKKPAQQSIKDVAATLKMPFVSHRWIGGTLSNFSQVKKSVTKLLHFQDVLDRSDKFPNYTKKELNIIQKSVKRLQDNIGGITNLSWPIGAIVIIDVRKEHSALKEAVRMGLPVVALVDTNNDPSGVNYVIPGNDDSPRSIKTILEYLSEFAARGAANAKTVEKQEETAAEQSPDQIRLALQEEEEGRKRRSSGGRSTPARRPRRTTGGSDDRRGPKRA